MPANILKAIILILLIIRQLESYDSSSKYFRRTAVSSEIEQTNQCTYGGGTINNSTVIEIGNCQEFFYFIGLSLGTPPQYFNFQFDTGSPTLWIPVGSNPSAFDQNQSLSFTLTNQTQSIQYADGSGVSGNLGTDLISVAQTPISVNGSILFANNSTVTFSNTSVYGLVGMDYTSYPNFLDDAYQNGQISSPAFALDLNYANQTSYMYYNDGLPEMVKQQTVWIQMSGTDHWELELIGFSAGGIDMTSQAANTAIIDSGTSLIVFNQDLYDTIILEYFSTPDCLQDGQGNTYCNCNGTWPQLTFMFLGAEVYIPGQAYQLQEGNGTCQVGIETLSSVSDIIILGDTFFREYTISFDRVGQQIGFYGKFTPVSIIDPQYLVISQYVLCGMGIALAFTGIGLWLIGRSKLQNGFESKLGMQLMMY